VGKTMSARDMLQAGRRPTSSPTQRPDAEPPAPPRADGATSELVDSAPSSLEGPATSALVDSATSPLDTKSTRTSPLDDQVTSTSQLVAQSYQRATFFLTAAQRRWLKDTAHDLPAGLSASDVVRLAVSRLRSDIEAGGVNLVDALVAQAHAEAATHPGRRNRGLPERHVN
jgi:hypothetical protein